MMRPKPAACIAGKRRVGAGKGRDQIDREQSGPIFRRRIGEERMLVDAGIVDDDIERSVLRHDRLHHAGVADIEPHRGRTNLPGKTGCRFDIEISDHDVSTGIGKAAHDRRTNALARRPRRRRGGHRAARKAGCRAPALTSVP